jgi:hypothetical protein
MNGADPEPKGDVIRSSRQMPKRLVALVLAVTPALVAAWALPASADGPEQHHPSGLVLLPPRDIAAIVRQGPMPEPLARAWSDARLLAEQNPDVLGHPWADRAKGELVIAVVNPQGEAIARSWMARGAAQAVSKPTPRLLPPTVAVRFRTTEHSFRQLETIQHEAIGKGAAGYNGDNRIWSSGVEEEHQRVVLETDRVVDPFLFALAKKYGSEVIAVRVDPHAGPFTTTSGQTGPSPLASSEQPGPSVVAVGALGTAAILLTGAAVMLRRVRRARSPASRSLI